MMIYVACIRRLHRRMPDENESAAPEPGEARGPVGEFAGCRGLAQPGYRTDSLDLGVCLGLEFDLVVLAVLLHLGESGDDEVDDAEHDEHGRTQSTGFWLPTRPRTKTPTGVPMKQPS